MNGWMNDCMNGLMNGWMNNESWTNELLDGWMAEWIQTSTLFIKRNSLVETASHTGHYPINIVWLSGKLKLNCI